jgi:ATP-dependent Lhr-like helicase
LRKLEARGEIRGGRFIAGLHGEQFALPEAIDSLRGIRRKREKGNKSEFVRISACDPLNLAGILTPGARISSVLGNRVIFREGVPVAAIENGQTRILAQVDADERVLLDRLLEV